MRGGGGNGSEEAEGKPVYPEQWGEECGGVGEVHAGRSGGRVT